MTIEVLKRWVDTKKLYEDTVKKSKPSDSILLVFRKSTGIENSLKDFEKLNQSAADNLSKGSLAKLTKGAATVDDAIEKYLVVLAKSSAADKGASPAYTTGLKLLKNDLKAIQIMVANECKNLAVSFETLGETDPMVALAKGMDNIDKQKLSNIVFGVRNLNAALLKVQAKPNFDSYLETVPKAIRDLSVEITPNNLPDNKRSALGATKPYPKAEILAMAKMETGGTMPTDLTEAQQYMVTIKGQLTEVVAWVKSMPAAKF